MTLKFVTVCFIGHACVVFAVVYNNIKFLRNPKKLSRLKSIVNIVLVMTLNFVNVCFVGHA